ncbi:RSLE3 protein, partial [Indicator maculatus]|nr:RSLE3 protein [Indicator maculatus]
PGYNLPPSSKRKREKLSQGGGGGGQELGVCCVDRRKSKVWNFYSKLGDAYVECNICRKQLSFHNSTTTMREHLVRKHHIKDAFFTSSSSSSSSSQLREDQAPEWELSPQDSLKRSRLEAGSYPSLENRWEVVVELVVEMIFKDLQPLSVVRDKGFSLLLGCLEPGFRLPSLEKVREVLGSRYQAGKEELQRYLQVAAEEVVVSLEQWSCPQQCQGYVGTAVNLIDGDWRRARCLLQTRRAGGQGLLGAREELQAALQEFGLTTEAVFCVVHDGPEEEEEEGQELKATSRGWRRLPCAARVLQCCV